MYIELENQAGKILLVDDTPANLGVLGRLLEPHGYEISTANSGEVALQIAPEFLPDLILLDIMMQGIDGLETCRQLKAKQETKAIPIIFISALNEMETVVKGFRAGGVDYITKPFKQEEVLARVRVHVNSQILTRQRKELIDDLEVKNVQLLELNEIKNKFLGMASHDLLNPLNGILGFTDLIKDQQDDLDTEKNMDYINHIQNASLYMIAIIKDLLDVSAMESGKIEISLNKGSINKLVESHIKSNGILAEKKNISLNLEETNIPDFLFDPFRIGRAIDNLLSNAIKYSPLGSKVELILKKVDQRVHFSIKDEGPGISQDDLAHLFKPFHKLASKPTAGEGSNGLGLSITKFMIEAHLGTISVDSTIGNGSTFSFSIPFDL
jgi:two-component system, sensor histidine kinase and response regulator